MLRKSEGREWFLAIAMGIFILTPIFTLLFPRAIANTLHHSSSHIVLYVTNGSYIVYFIACVLFFTSVLLVYLLWGNKSSIYLSIGALLLSGLCFYMASQHYIAIGTDAITYNPLFSTKEHAHQWEDIEQVFYKRGSAEDSRWQYEFTFRDGEKLTVIENGYIEEIKHLIINRLKEENINIKN